MLVVLTILVVHHFKKLLLLFFSCVWTWFFQKQPPEAFCKKGVVKNFAKFTGNTFARVFFTKLQTLAQLFSCEFCEIFKSTFCTEHLWMTASVLLFQFNFFVLYITVIAMMSAAPEVFKITKHKRRGVTWKTVIWFSWGMYPLFLCVHLPRNVRNTFWFKKPWMIPWQFMFWN